MVTSSHLLAFCRESHFVANTCFLGLFCADFYADIWDLTQILRRYLDQKSAADSSGIALVSLEKWRSYDCPISTQPSPRLILSVRTSCKRDLFLFSFILSFWSITERIVLVSVFESHRSCVRLAAASYEVRQQGLKFTIWRQTSISAKVFWIKFPKLKGPQEVPLTIQGHFPK